MATVDLVAVIIITCRQDQPMVTTHARKSTQIRKKTDMPARLLWIVHCLVVYGSGHCMFFSGRLGDGHLFEDIV